MNKRHYARIYVFQFLYRLQLEEFIPMRVELIAAMKTRDAKSYLDAALLEFDSLLFAEQKLEGSNVTFAYEVIAKTLAEYDSLIQMCRDSSDSWSKTKNNSVDLTILIMSLSEIIYIKTPVPVVINEAIELAKKFSRKESPSLINGILDRIAGKL